MSTSRLEKFIYAICSMDVSDLPVPLSRIETLWNCLITGETPDFEPLSRNEKYLMAMLDCYDISNLPAPMSRGEKLLYKIAVGETDLSDVPAYLSRYEELLKYLIENGGIGGGDFEYVLHTLNQALSTLYSTAEKPVKRVVAYGDTLVNTLQESSTLAVTPMGEAIDAQQATVTGTANGAIQSAILKGSTKYKDVETGEILDEFDAERNLELVSVKMPVLTTVGKNLFDKEAFYNDWKSKHPTYMYKEIVDGEEVLKINNLNLLYADNRGFKIFVEKDVPLTLTIKCKKAGTNDTKSVLIVRYSESSFISVGGCQSDVWVERTITFTPIRDYITICSTYNVNDYFYIKDIQLEVGSVKTPYEPYKTNILTVNEDVELGSVGEVKDELNLLTGQLTQRTETRAYQEGDESNSEVITDMANTRYKLPKESIKTVDLTLQDQDGNTVPHLQAFNGATHFSTSSNGLAPNVVIPATVSYPSIIKPSTLYTVKLKHSVTSGTLTINAGGTEQTVTKDCFTLTTPATLTSQDVTFSGKGNVISEVTVVEGDQTAKDYGYFEGMQSVQMSGITMTGKNLASSKIEMGNIRSIDGILSDSNVHIRTKDYIPINPSINKVTLSNNKGYIGVIFQYDKDYKFIKYTSGKTDTTTATLNENCSFIKFRTTDSSNATDLTTLFQLEYGSINSPYEPYKTNILTVNEPIELPGIGDVKDTLDCLTGEYVQRIGEVKITDEMIDKFTIYKNFINNFSIVFDGLPERKIVRFEHGKPIPMVSDKMAVNLWSNGTMVENTVYFTQDKDGEMRIYHTPDWTLDEFKEWFRENKPTIQYQLATESVKTVDLTVVDQDNQPTKLGTFENLTHVSLESGDLVPTVEMEVATNLLEDSVFNLTNAFNTLYPTAAKPVVDGVLKGQTLVNLCKPFEFDIQTTGSGLRHLANNIDMFNIAIKDNKQYSIWVEIDINEIGPFSLSHTGAVAELVFKEIKSGLNLTSGHTIIYPCTKCSNSSNRNFTIGALEGSTEGRLKGRIMVFEGDVRGFELSYFTGMQSVKLPVLTTTGKNLLKQNLWESGYINVNTGVNETSINHSRYNDFIPVNTGDVFSFSSSTNVWRKYFLYDSNKNFLQTSPAVSTKNLVINIENTQAKYMRIWIQQNIDTLDNDIQLEVGTQATSYEPYKSNILTTSEEVELRGIGDMQDTLNCLTGEVISNFNIITLDGTEVWSLNVGAATETTLTFATSISDRKERTSIICTNYPVSSSFNTTIENIYGGVSLSVVVKKERLTTTDLTGFRQWLSQNPLKVQYQLATPIVKTVELTIQDQDGKTTTLKTFDDTTHVLLDSEAGPNPTATLTVRTKIPTASSTSLRMDDISVQQQESKETVQEQSGNIDAALMAVTEIYEEIL